MHNLGASTTRLHLLGLGKRFRITFYAKRKALILCPGFCCTLLGVASRVADTSSLHLLAEPFVPRCSFSLVYVCLSHLGASTSPTALLIGLWGHGRLSSPTARCSHLRLARLGSERGSHHLGEHRKSR